MNKILLIYSAIVFIAGVVLFTYSRLKKATPKTMTVITEDTEPIDTPEDESKKEEDAAEAAEFSKWLMILSFLLVIIAAACLILSFNV